MKAIRTTDTHEWVRRTVYNRWRTENPPSVYLETEDIYLECAIQDTGHPCEWVEIEVLVKSDAGETVTDRDVELTINVFFDEIEAMTWFDSVAQKLKFDAIRNKCIKWMQQQMKGGKK